MHIEEPLNIGGLTYIEFCDQGHPITVQTVSYYFCRSVLWLTVSPWHLSALTAEMLDFLDQRETEIGISARKETGTTSGGYHVYSTGERWIEMDSVKAASRDLPRRHRRVGICYVVRAMGDDLSSDDSFYSGNRHPKKRVTTGSKNAGPTKTRGASADPVQSSSQRMTRPKRGGKGPKILQTLTPSDALDAI